MSQVQIQCPGCNRAFSPRGLSQHVSRSQCSSCRSVLQGSKLASNTTSWDHSTGPSNELDLEHSTTHDGKVSKLCGRSLTNLLTTDRVYLANNAETSPNKAAEHTDFAAAAAPLDHEDTVGAVDHEYAVDPTDAIDADLLETLTRDFNHPATDGPELATPEELPLVGSHSSDPVPPPPIHFKCGVSDSTSQIIVDSFPHGSAGAPIPGAYEGSHIYQSTQEAFGASIWAPFRSECDWEIARWAKMRGPSSSAVADLFAIPGVCNLHALLSFLLLMEIGR